MSSSSDKRKVGIISQARVGSSRLPAKTLRTINGITLLGHHLNRLKDSNQSIYLATTYEQDAPKLIEIATGLGIDIAQGSTDDVLTRFYVCAKKYDLDVVVRVTSDCPLIDGGLIADGVRQFLSLSDWKNSYLSNTQNRYLPRGFDFEIFSFLALETAHLSALTLSEREHVTPYIYQSGKFKVSHYSGFSDGKDRSGYRVTVDTPEDYELIRLLIENHQAEKLNVIQICEILDRNPEIRKINEAVQQKKI